MSPRGSTRDAAGLPDNMEGSEGEAERFDPLQDGPDLAYEHLHRYVLAGQVVEGLRVLDLAAGTGYGSSILARTARSLVSLDLESAHLGSLEAGVCGDAQLLPFAEGSFDAVVCFEAVEHVPDPAKLVSEAKRVLRGPSILMISTPDREIYTGRAKHENPFHVAEMNRREFQNLLRGHFGHVRILGQGLWAGSWIAGLAPGQAARGLGERRVEAIRLPEGASGAGSREQSVRWADSAMEELPTPIYLLAACADAKSGRLLLARTLPPESILHDSGQWLLGQYDRLAQAWGGELSSFQAELARAKEGHEDQSAQIQVARASMARLEDQIEKARGTVADLEAQIVEARRGNESQARELASARENADDQDRQLAHAGAEAERFVARIGELEGEADRAAELQVALEMNLTNCLGDLEEAKASTTALESQISIARAANDELDLQVSGAREANADLEGQVSTARSLTDQQSAELVAARAAADDQAIRLGAARDSIDGKDRELDAARETIAGKDRELVVAKAGVDAKERELGVAREAIDEKDREIAAARSTIDAQERELEAARSVIDDRDRELSVASASARDAEGQIEGAHEKIENQQDLIRRAAERADDRDHEISALAAAVEAAGRRTEEDARRIEQIETDREAELRRRRSLEVSQERFFARLGGGLSDWIERFRGAGQ